MEGTDRARSVYFGAGALGLAALGGLVAVAVDAPAVLLDRPWLDPTGSAWRLEMTAGAALLAVTAAALFVLVIAYAAAYLPPHLEHAEGRASGRRQAYFVGLLTAFMAAMVLLALADDLLVMFVALELTAVLSFLLVAYDGTEEAKRNAVTALLVTAGTSLPFLAGALLLASDAGTTTLVGLKDWSRSGGEDVVACSLIAIGLVAKSAQVPLHFWLPRAMVAPTPVSAYLHSAALVAAGVFVMMRLDFLLSTPFVATALQIIGWTSIAVGSARALVEVHLKRILAYSTIAQYGYITVLVTLHGPESLPAAALYLFVHALAKCALFMTAGAVITDDGHETLDEIAPSYARRAPLLAASAGVACATLAGLPLTLGFAKDELFFAALAEGGVPATIGGVLAASATLAYSLRFFFGVFFAPGAPRPGRVEIGLYLPIAVIAVPLLVGGVWLAPAEQLARAAGAAFGDGPVEAKLAYHFAPTRTTMMAVAAWVLGSTIYRTRHLWRRTAEAVVGLVSIGAIVDRVFVEASRIPDAIHRWEARDLRDRVGGIVVPCCSLVLAALIFARPTWLRHVGVTIDDAPLILCLLCAAVAATGAALSRDHFSVVMLLTFAGYAIALAMALLGAPDVALVTAVVETVMTLLLLGALLPFRRLAKEPPSAEEQRRAPWIAAFGGVVIAAAVYVVLSTPAAPSIVAQHIALAEHAHAKDVVTVILSDFRGLDTAVEVTVLVVAVVGAVASKRGVPS